jgi:hypothetical protein
MEFACYSEWDQLPESADLLFADAAEDSVFFSRPWFENLVGHALEDGQSMLLACVVDGDRVLAILPLMSRGGGHLHALGHLYTSLYSLLLARHDRQEILACLANGLRQLPADSLRLAPIADDDSRLQQLQQAMESKGYACFRNFRFYNWVHRLRGESFAEYMAGRPSRVRNTIARKQRKLEREQGYSIRLFGGDDLHQGMADYNAVYNASWKAKELFGDFVHGLAKRLSGQGWLRLAVLYIAGKPAAAQFWFVSNGKASIFKLAYDEAWKRYSPGSILIHRLMEHVIEIDQVEEIDFLTGNDAYKQDWMSERRERWGLYCAKPRPPKGRADRLLDAVKGWLQRHKRTAAGDRWSLNPQQRCIFSSRQCWY